MRPQLYAEDLLQKIMMPKDLKILEIILNDDIKDYEKIEKILRLLKNV